RTCWSTSTCASRPSSNASPGWRKWSSKSRQYVWRHERVSARTANRVILRKITDYSVFEYTMDTSKKAEPALLLDDLESIRQLLGDDNLQPPLLTDTVHREVQI
ncbi:hypothetical protein ALQ47_04874, partial [Pseudomonas cichorii]